MQPLPPRDALPADPALPQLLSQLRRQLEKQGLESTQTVFRVQGTCTDCGTHAGNTDAGTTASTQK